MTQTHRLVTISFLQKSTTTRHTSVRNINQFLHLCSSVDSFEGQSWSNLISYYFFYWTMIINEEITLIPSFTSAPSSKNFKKLCVTRRLS